MAGFGFFAQKAVAIRKKTKPSLSLVKEGEVLASLQRIFWLVKEGEVLASLQRIFWLVKEGEVLASPQPSFGL